MRVACLPLLALISLFVCCQSVMRDPAPGPEQSQEKYRYDTLKKYSYLVIGLPKKFDGSLDLVAVEVSSGFFFRHDGKLYLVSAYHVLTNCDVYVDSLQDRPKDSLEVWYTDKQGKYKFARFPPKMIPGLPLKPAKRTLCYSVTNIADVAVIDVTGYFEDGEINSIEGMIPENWQNNPVLPGDSVVGYGYHNVKQRPQQGTTAVPSPAFVECGVIEMPDKLVSIPDTDAVKLKKALVPRYGAITPGLPEGISGAPLFKIWSGKDHMRMVEFVGVQSGTAKGENHSLMVRPEEVMQLLIN